MYTGRRFRREGKDMTKKEIAEVLEEVRKQPEIAERVKQESPQDISAFWAKILAEKGYNVSSEEIASFIREAEEERRKKTQENAGKIVELSDQELDKVAGGGDHSDCSYTYKDKENCWCYDACDIVDIYYTAYICKYTYKCNVLTRYS